MTNDNVLAGIACPKCKSEGPFNIDGQATFLRVTDDGCDEFERMEWNEESYISCVACSHVGIIEEFHVDEDEDDLPPGEVVATGNLADFLGGLKK